jgi:hypothetical protein
VVNEWGLLLAAMDGTVSTFDIYLASLFSDDDKTYL